MKPLALAALLIAAPATAQNFTTAAEVQPILEATKANWIAVRKWEGQDLLYFTHLEAWRCGLTSVSFSINDTPPRPYPLAPCDETSAQPNALPDGTLPYRAFPLDSIQIINVEIIYDNGAKSNQGFERSAVEIN